MHWPVAFGREKKGKIVKSPKDSEGNILIDPHLTEHWLRTWREMERLVQDGLVRNIGVSNFSIKKLVRLTVSFSS